MYISIRVNSHTLTFKTHRFWFEFEPGIVKRFRKGFSLTLKRGKATLNEWKYGWHLEKVVKVPQKGRR